MRHLNGNIYQWKLKGFDFSVTPPTAVVIEGTLTASGGSMTGTFTGTEGGVVLATGTFDGTRNQRR